MHPAVIVFFCACWAMWFASSEQSPIVGFGFIFAAIMLAAFGVEAFVAVRILRKALAS
jgi:uncharacterized membrane protein YedE/YeeE